MSANTPPGKPIYRTEDARLLARRRIPRMMYDLIAGATGREMAARENPAAFAKIRLQPRVLINTEERTPAHSILGEETGRPFGIAPMGMCNLVWPGADRMLAAAAARLNIPLGVSTLSSTSMEDLHRQSEGRAWFQLYAVESAESTLQMAARAHDAGYTRLILTADVPQIARRIRDLKNGLQMPFRMGVRQFLDFAAHPRWSAATLRHGAPRPMNFAASGPGGFSRTASRGAADWAFLDQLRAQWKGKLIVKGVLCAQDARHIKEAGADAVYVSNHGGRQLDSAPPAIDILPGIRAALGADYQIIFDSGIRSGEDIVKALALGADFVMIGRPALYAIGADGARGLAKLLDLFSEEMTTVMAQLGTRHTRDLGPHNIAPNAAQSDIVSD